MKKRLEVWVIKKFKIKKKLGIFREKFKLFYNFTYNKFGSNGYCVKLFNFKSWVF
jgi:hypothetical protein